MKNMTCAVVLLCAIFFAMHARAGQEDGPDMKAVSDLDQQAIKVLNIDLNSLRWLLGASCGSYLLQEPLVKENQLGAIEALQKNGYAKIEVGVDEMPGGIRGAFLRICPTEKGRRIIDLLTGPAR